MGSGRRTDGADYSIAVIRNVLIGGRSSKVGGKLGGEMTSYKIAIDERGKEALWRDYWVSNDAVGTEEQAPTELGRTRVVEATSYRPRQTGTSGLHSDASRRGTSRCLGAKRSNVWNGWKADSPLNWLERSSSAGLA